MEIAAHRLTDVVVVELNGREVLANMVSEASYGQPFGAQ